jgi:phosphoesterase RecJ-like protein
MPAQRTTAQAERARLLAAEMDPTLATAAWRLIEPARRILLLAHEHPDPDALGSALGLAQVIETPERTCVVACADPVPENFRGFLPGWERVVSTLPEEPFDLVIAPDAGELSRYGALTDHNPEFFANATILNLDHHVSSVGCGAVTIIDPTSAATAELLTLFLLHIGAPIGRDAACNLLAGIITDTRSFEFDATTPRTLMAGAYLVGCGAVPERIIKPMYRLKPLAKVRLWSRVLDRELRTSTDGRIVWAALRQEHLLATGATADLDDGLSAYMLDVNGVAMAALFKEQPGGATKVSLRSIAPYDVNAVASRFGGGGHVRASGCTLDAPVDEAIRLVVPAMEEELARTDRSPRDAPVV